MSTERNADHGGESNASKDNGHDRELTIVVNGRERTVTGKELNFDMVAALGLGTVPTGENVLITITYRRGHGEKPEGNLLPGGTVKIKEGMVFVVTATDKS